MNIERFKYINPRYLNRQRKRYRNQKKIYKSGLKSKAYLNQYLSLQYDEFNLNQEQNLPIWQLWLQGEEQAPQLVKNCLESVKYFCPKRKINVLSLDNLYDYIDLPDYIINKYQQGIISNTHFSDIVRVCLLCKHGGTWIDSTVLLTGSIPQEIENSEFFCFSSPDNSIYKEIHLISSWFIHSQKQHPFLLNVQNTLYRYWQIENTLIDYFTFHIAFRNMIDGSIVMKNHWDKLYHITNEAPHILNNQLKDKFNSDVFYQATSKSNIHKLTYKVSNADTSSLFEYLNDKDFSIENLKNYENTYLHCKP